MSAAALAALFAKPLLVCDRCHEIARTEPGRAAGNTHIRPSRWNPNRAHTCGTWRDFGLTQAELCAARAALEWFSDLLALPGTTGPIRFMRTKSGRLWRRNLRNARAALERELAVLVFVDQARVRR